MSRLLFVAYIAALAAAVYGGVQKVDAARTHWLPAHVTSYATWEPGLSHFTACPSPYGRLDDYGYTVAVRYGIGLDGRGGLPACGQHIYLTDGRRTHLATVTDRTLSRYDMELSYALSRVFGAPAQTSGWLTWSGHLRWRLASCMPFRGRLVCRTP
jgi:hypothetical protein